MNEEIPFNPPGLAEYIREGARKNSALLRKMQGKPETVQTETAQPGSLHPAGYAAFAKRYWSCNWQEAVTVIRETPNGWRIRWETGPKAGRCATITRRNWSIMPRNNVI